MNLLKSVVRSKGLFPIKPHQGLPSLSRDLPRHFSTETKEQQLPATPAIHDSSVNPILGTLDTGSVYGRLIGTSKHTLKTDIINLLEGVELSPQDIKVEYNRLYYPVGMIVQFSSRYAFDSALRAVIRKRIYRLDKVHPGAWDVQSFEGKTVLLQGLSRNVQPEDIERFLSGSELGSSNFQVFLRAGFPEPTKTALVEFPSQVQATAAVLSKNRSFCLNNQISMRVLQ